jgi:hypothetical protein
LVLTTVVPLIYVQLKIQLKISYLCSVDPLVYVIENKLEVSTVVKIKHKQDVSTVVKIEHKQEVSTVD